MTVPLLKREGFPSKTPISFFARCLRKEGVVPVNFLHACGLAPTVQKIDGHP